MIKKALIITLTASLLVLMLAVPAAAITRPTASATPVGTLVIGTHLIYVPSMTSSLYEAAQLSAADASLNSQQNSVFYKSEFAGGKWVDISAAANIYDLSAVSGKLVDDSVIDSLTLKFYTPSDGKTYSLITGRQVAVSDILPPYDAKSQAEMEPLVSSLSALDPENEDNEYAINILNGILNSNYQSVGTAYLDTAIGQLNSMLNQMRDAKASAQKQEALSQLISKLDHRRRAVSLALMRDKVTDGLSKAGEKDLQGLITTMSPVVEALETQIQAHLAIGGESGGETGAETKSGKDKIRDELESKLLGVLSSDEPLSDTDADALLQELMNMDNLDSGAVVSPEEELETALKIIDELCGEFLAKLGGGAIDELVAASFGDPFAIRMAEEKQAEIFENLRLGIQSAIEAAGLRMDAQAYESLISSMLTEARGMPGNVKNDASKPKAMESIQSYTDWLNAEFRKAGEESPEKTEAQLLQIEINELEEKSKAALDKNDLALADSLDREIEDKAAKLSALEDDIAAKLLAANASVEALKKDAETAALSGNEQLAESLNGRIDALQSEINALEAALPTDVREAQGEIARMKQEALAAIVRGDGPAVAANIEGIAAFAEREPAAALNAIETISNAILREKSLSGTNTASLSEEQQSILRLVSELREKVSALADDDIAVSILTAEEAVEALVKESEAAALNGDGKTASSLEPQINALQSEIKALEAKLPADIRAARAEIDKVKQEAVKASGQGNANANALAASIEAISSLAEKEPVAALNAAEEIESVIAEHKMLSGTDSGVLDSAQELVSALLPGLNDKASTIGAIDYQRLRELCDSMLEPLPNDASARIMAVIQTDGGKNDSNLMDMLDEYYSTLPSGQGFTAATRAGVRYVPAAIIPNYMNLRFLPEKNNTCLLANGAVYYRFTQGGVSVSTNSGAIEMDNPVYYGGDVAYLPESFVNEQFGFSVLDIPNRGKVTLIDDSSAKKAEAIVAALKGD